MNSLSGKWNAENGMELTKVTGLNFALTQESMDVINRLRKSQMQQAAVQPRQKE